MFYGCTYNFNVIINRTSLGYGQLNMYYYTTIGIDTL